MDETAAAHSVDMVVEWFLASLGTSRKSRYDIDIT